MSDKRFCPLEEIMEGIGLEYAASRGKYDVETHLRRAPGRLMGRPLSAHTPRFRISSSLEPASATIASSAVRWDIPTDTGG